MSVPERGQKVTTVALHLEMGQRVAAWFRQRHPRHTAKLLAQDYDTAEATAKKIIGGRLPSAPLFARMLKKEGPGFAGLVLQPCGDWASLLKIQADLDVLEERAAQARDDLVALKAELRAAAE